MHCTLFYKHNCKCHDQHDYIYLSLFKYFLVKIHNIHDGQPNIQNQLTHFAQLKILKTVGTQFYPSFDLHKPEETSPSSRPIALDAR